MKKLLLILFIGITGIGVGQNIEEIIKEKIALIELETDSLTKVKLRFEDSLLNLHTSHKTILSPLKEKLQLAINNKNEIDSDLSAARNNFNDLSNNFETRYGEEQTIMRLVSENRRNRSLEELKVNTNIIKTPKIDRNSQINYYQFMTKLKFIFHKINKFEDISWNLSFTANGDYQKKLLNWPSWKTRYSSTEPICYVDLNNYERLKTIRDNNGCYLITPYYEKKPYKAYIPRNQDEVAIGYIDLLGDKMEYKISSEQVIYQFPDKPTVNFKKRHKKIKVDAGLKENGFYLLEGQDKEDYLYSLTGIDKNYFDLNQQIKVLDSTINELTPKMELVNKDIPDFERQIKNIEQKQKREINPLSSKIDLLTKKIDSKDERIANVPIEEDRRLEAVTEGDKYKKEKNYEMAISKYKMALNIRQSDDINDKLEKANKLYEPILAKEQEEQRVAKVERDRLAREEARRKERMLGEKIKVVVEFYPGAVPKRTIAVAQYDLPNKMSWEEALSACSELGNGWRLPTVKECIYIKVDLKYNGFDEKYWTSEEKDFDRAESFNAEPTAYKKGRTTRFKREKLSVRVVRDTSN